MHGKWLARLRTALALTAVLIVSLGGFWVCDRLRRSETALGVLLLVVLVVLLFLPVREQE